MEKTIERRTEQISILEKMYQGKLEDAKKELEQFKAAARDTEKSIQQEVKLAKEDKAKTVAELELQISGANDELNEVREAKNTLLLEKNKLESFTDDQKAIIDRLETEL